MYGSRVRAPNDSRKCRDNRLIIPTFFFYFTAIAGIFQTFRTDSTKNPLYILCHCRDVIQAFAYISIKQPWILSFVIPPWHNGNVGVRGRYQDGQHTDNSFHKHSSPLRLSPSATPRKRIFHRTVHGRLPSRMKFSELLIKNIGSFYQEMRYFSIRNAVVFFTSHKIPPFHPQRMSSQCDEPPSSIA